MPKVDLFSRLYREGPEAQRLETRPAPSTALPQPAPPRPFLTLPRRGVVSWLLAALSSGCPSPSPAWSKQDAPFLPEPGPNSSCSQVLQGSSPPESAGAPSSIPSPSPLLCPSLPLPNPHTNISQGLPFPHSSRPPHPQDAPHSTVHRAVPLSYIIRGQQRPDAPYDR